MEVHARRGDVAKGLQVYDRLRVLLRDELGASPAAAVTALNERLLARGAGTEPAPPVEEPAAPTGGEVPVPAALARADRQAFVGRSEELERLQERWRVARGGDGGIVLLTGDAGIGKTRLAARLSVEAHADGAIVLFGRCDQEGVGPPYEPFVEALRHYAAHDDGLAAGPALAPYLAELRRLVPELGGPGAAPDVTTGPEHERYRLFEAVVALLGHIAASRPLLLVLEDLHWADEPTLLLLRQVVRRTQAAPLLVIGSYRDLEVESAAPLARVLADLRREHAVERISLTGLDDAETAALASEHASAPIAALVRQLRAQTAGNPFFIEEILRSLGDSAGGDELAEGVLNAMGVPESIAVTIARRCDRLSPGAADALTIAAVLGQEFQVGALRMLADEDGVDTIAALDETLEAGLVVEYPEQVDLFAFRHALVRNTLYERLSPGRRWRLHLRAGETLAAARDQLAVHPAQLAHHFFESRHVGGADRAIEFAAEAAQLAADARAYEEAARHYERALSALRLARPGDDAALCDLLLALGGVRWQAAARGAREPFVQAAEAARRLGSPERLAAAALGAGGRFYAPVAADPAYRALVEEALTALEESDSPVRARLLTRLAENVAVAEPGERARAHGEAAVAMARRLGDDDALAAALMGLHAALLDAGHAGERRAAAEEALTLARGSDSLEATALTTHWLLYDLFELGELDEARRRLAELERVAGELQQPLYRHSALAWRGVFAQFAGRLGEAERLARESLRLAERAGTPDAGRHFTAQLLAVRREQRRLAELLPDVSRLADDGPGGLVWRAVLPLVQLDAGDGDAARAAHARMMSAELDTLEPSMSWLTTVAFLSEAAVELEDADGAAKLYELLRPHAGLLVQNGFTGCWGSVERFLGRLAIVLGNREAAEQHLRAALERHEALGADALAARTRVALGSGEAPQVLDWL